MLVECGGDELSVTVFNFRPADMKLVYQDASQGDADGIIGGGAVYAVYAMAYTYFTQCMPGIALAYTL